MKTAGSSNLASASVAAKPFDKNCTRWHLRLHTRNSAGVLSIGSQRRRHPHDNRTDTWQQQRRLAQRYNDELRPVLKTEPRARENAAGAGASPTKTGHMGAAKLLSDSVDGRCSVT